MAQRRDEATAEPSTPTGTSVKDTTGRRAMALFAPYRGRLVLIALAILTTSALGVVTPFLTQRVLRPGPVRPRRPATWSC